MLMIADLSKYSHANYIACYLNAFFRISATENIKIRVRRTLIARLPAIWLGKFSPLGVKAAALGNDGQNGQDLDWLGRCCC